MYFGDNSEKKLTDKRAVELWNIARNSGKFSQNELESIKVRKFFEISSSCRFCTLNTHIPSYSLVFIVLFHWPIKWCHHIEISQLICTANQVAGFYIRATLAFNRLTVSNRCMLCSSTQHLNHFATNFLFLYPLKASANHRSSHENKETLKSILS